MILLNKMLFVIIICENSLNILCEDIENSWKGMCGERREEERTNRIVGGSDTYYGEVPWQVRLHITLDNTVTQCGAVLIHPNWVLTAAHCVRYTGNHCPKIIAFFGEHRLTNRYIQSNALKNLSDNKNTSNSITKWSETRYKSVIVSRNASEIIINENFNAKTFESDIALIRLNQSVQNDDNIQAICLPQLMQDFSGRDGYISGFGVLESDSRRVPHILQIVSVPILSAEFCDYMFQQLGYNDVMKWGKLCAGVIDGGRDACAGDSGGPLTVRRSEDNKWLLVGIISNGIKCGQPYTPGLYTQVSAFVDWINAVIDNDAKYL